MICSIDTETGGLLPYYHEVLDICILPLLDDFSVNDAVQPFQVAIRPQFFDRLDPKALEVNGHTVEELQKRDITRETATNMFKEWFVTVMRKVKIEPLGWNWTFDRMMLQATFKGIDFNQFFFYRVRDGQNVAMYLNDRHRLLGNAVPFKSTALTGVASALELDYPAQHSALGDAMMAAKVYRKLTIGR